MNSSIAWAILPLAALVLGWVGHHFSLPVLRVVTLFTAAATVVYITRYGLTHPAPLARTHPVRGGGSLVDAFARGADAVSVALFHAAPGQTGWIVIAAGLVIGYRQLEAWTLRGQARSLDMSALSADQADGKPDDGSGDGKGTGPDKRTDAMSDKQAYDRLTAELKFRLPAVEVRAPAIFPGGSRTGGLASIAEASGFAAGGLAGAIINFFGMLWPGPRRLRVRVWIEPSTSNAGSPEVSRVSVHLDDPQTGVSIATKTLAAKDVDEAASMVAGYVARYIFTGDRTAPPWCTGATDGRDLGALLLARQERDYPESEERVCQARHRQIGFLEGVTRSPQCAGVTRYELAQLYDLTGRHVRALFMHAINREQFPHFYRGRYRLAMSLEMIANARTRVAISSEEDVEKFNKALKILWKCGVLEDEPPILEQPDSGCAELTRELQASLLKAAWKELLAIRRYLSLPSIAWHSFWRHNERGILRPYWRQSYRQAFHDGVWAALLLVAVRRAEVDPDGGKHRLRRARPILRVAAAITGDDAPLAETLQVRKVRRAKGQPRPVTKTLRTRHWFRPYSTRSWQAGYSLACAYAAVMQTRLAEYEDKGEWDEGELRSLTRLMVNSLEFTVCNPACEMERPGDWIGNDPDFSFLHPGENGEKKMEEEEKERRAFADFRAFLDTQRLRDYPFVLTAQAALEEQLACPMSGSARPLAGPAEAEAPVADLV